MYKLIVFFTFSLFTFSGITSIKLHAQEENMDMYLAEFEKGLGSINYRNDLFKNPPSALYPFLVITGPQFTKCNPEGFPENEAFRKNMDHTEKIEKLIHSKTSLINAGSFIYQCDHRVYFYISDTTGIRKKLVEYYNNKMPGNPYFIQIKEDKQWEVYKTFLFPSKEIILSNKNARALLKLKNTGVDLEKEKVIIHKVNFHRSIERDTFIKKMVVDGFSIVGLQKIKHPEFPFQLSFSKAMILNEENINALTEKLMKELEALAGDYESWDIE